MVTGIKGEELVSPRHRRWRWVGSLLSMLRLLPQHLLAQSSPADARVARWWRRLAACCDESRQASPVKQTRGNSSRPKHKHAPSRETGGKRRSAFALLPHFCFVSCGRHKAAEARLAQSAERKALNLVVVGPSPSVGVCDCAPLQHGSLVCFRYSRFFVSGPC